MLLKRRATLLLTWLLVAFFTSWNVPAAEKIRPTGVPPPAEEESESSTPKPKSSAKKKSARRAAKSNEEAAAPLGTLPNGVPITKAQSVMVIDAQTGRTLYEKNPDESRAAA